MVPESYPFSGAAGRFKALLQPWVLAAPLFLLGLALCSSRAVPDTEVSQWEFHGRDSKEQRFSPLAEISDKTVDRLGLLWSLDLPGENALEATPLAIDGVIYFSGQFGKVYAVDARAGKMLWDYDPQANTKVLPTTPRLYGAHRGVAYWDGKIYVATKDCRMIAIDAKTGKEVWSASFLVPGTTSTSSGAPRIFRGKVIIGNSGAERNARGYVTTMDARTGKILWRFFIVPGDPRVDTDETTRIAAKTWSGEWWKYGGGGTPWNGITYDEELNQIYIGTGNAGPYDYPGRLEGHKDNLFISSVVALDPDTGKYKWHYQYNPLEVWDWKATADMILADLKIDGKSRKVLMQAPSNGFFYVIDRTTGKLISAEKIGKINWADRIDLKTGRPVETGDIRYEKGPAILYPSAIGAHNWQASSYNPQTGLVYIPCMQIGMKFWRTPEAAAKVKDVRKGGLTGVGVNMDFHVDPKDPLDGKGSLLAWDPVAQKLKWRVDYPAMWNAGTMTSAGNLVFQGTHTGIFYAYNAITGKTLWSFDARLGILSPPITYEVDGRQYVSLLVGYGAGGGEGSTYLSKGWKYGLQPRRLLTFALDGKATLPETPGPDMSVDFVDDPAIKLDPVKVRKGETFYHMMCTACHGMGAIATGGAPDLRGSSVFLDKSALTAVLHDGLLVENGMPRFREISDEQISYIYEYIRSRARESVVEEQRSRVDRAPAKKNK
jgi:quinohemoprotein ethanol dehydrogenase